MDNDIAGTVLQFKGETQQYRATLQLKVPPSLMPVHRIRLGQHSGGGGIGASGAGQ